MTTPRTQYPPTINNPTLEGFMIHATSPAIEGPFSRVMRAVAVSVPGIDPDRKAGSPHIIWQEQCPDTGAWANSPGSCSISCDRLIVALMTNR